MLISVRLLNVCHFSIVGSEIDLQKALILKKISEFDTTQYPEGKFIIKGCADIASPAFAMVELTNKLQPTAKSIMYGEPCSTVPIYKAPR
jgi:hypothetical protein